LTDWLGLTDWVIWGARHQEFRASFEFPALPSERPAPTGGPPAPGSAALALPLPVTALPRAVPGRLIDACGAGASHYRRRMRQGPGTDVASPARLPRAVPGRLIDARGALGRWTDTRCAASHGA